MLDDDLGRAILKFEGVYRQQRVIVAEVHRADQTVRYSYYILRLDNTLQHGFDNHGDRTAIKLRYGKDWADHQHEEIPHQHDAAGNVSPTEPMTFERFVAWLVQHFTE